MNKTGNPCSHRGWVWNPLEGLGNCKNSTLWTFVLKFSFDVIGWLHISYPLVFSLNHVLTMGMKFSSLIINSCGSEYLHFLVNILENNSKISWLPVKFLIPETSLWAQNTIIYSCYLSSDSFKVVWHYFYVWFQSPMAILMSSYLWNWLFKYLSPHFQCETYST